MGPCYEYRDFIDFNNGNLYASCPSKKCPSSWFPALIKFLTALVLLAFHFAFKVYFPVDYIYLPHFGERNVLYKVFYTICALQGVRFGYFFSFCLSEGTNILNGFGFNGYVDGKIQWDRLASVNVLEVEFAQSPRDITDNWNITAGHWLKYYVYWRTDKPSEKPSVFALYLTNITSALWHGFYPGYFIHFTTAALLANIARHCRAKVRPLFLNSGKVAKSIYDFLGFCAIKYYMGYSMAAFSGLTWEKCSTFHTNVGYMGHIILLISLLVGNILPTPKTTTTKDKLS